MVDANHVRPRDFNSPKFPTNHLFTQQLAAESPQTHDVGYGLGIPALG
jgi:hypothetical protein